MRRLSCILIFSFVAPLYALAVAIAQPAADAGIPPKNVWLGPGLDPAHGRVGLDVSVTDGQGHAVTGLKPSDFKILDDGQPLPLASFAASAANGPAPGDPPVSVVLVLDDADLSGASFAEVESDVESFLRGNGGRLTHPVTLYRVTPGKLYASIQYSRDGSAMADMLASGMGMRPVWTQPTARVLEQLSDKTQISFDPRAGVVLPWETAPPVPLPNALKALGTIILEQRREPGRKLLFWIGPGWHVNMKSDKDLFDTITEFSTRMREARIELSIANKWATGKADPRFVLSDEQVHQYAAGVRAAKDSNYDNLALQVLASRTGGELLTTNDELIATAQPDRNNIPRLLAEHIAEASNYYRLTFDPLQTDTLDDYHELKVELAKPGLTAHMDAGYYDEPSFYDQPMPANHVTVAQLEQRLARKQSDRALASELAELQLSERLSTPRLDAWLKRMPGSRSRQALTALADSSVFQPTPADEMLPLPAPNPAAEGAMLERVADFVAQQAQRLPNFYADRITVQFGEPMPKPGLTWKTAPPDRTLDYELTTTDHVYFENGKETTDQQKRKIKPHTQDLLETTGTFGPILVLVLKAATGQGGVLTWSHWEKGASGPLAVFHYISAPDMRVYGVGFCCMAVDGGMYPFNRMADFRGELAIDPATGFIIRITVKADLEPRLPIKDSDVMVEYGPVEMGSKTYICPLRSVSLSRQRRLWEMNEWDETFKLFGPYKSIVNDVTFSRYHLFRSETTILPGFVPVPQSQ